MLTHSNCPAVLTENLFMDNKEECRYLLSIKGKAAIANIHVKAIKKYLGYENK
jgi:N-acetylmuramoyl-L-alanine amidase